MQNVTASPAALARIRRSQSQSLGYLLIRCGQLWNQFAIGRVNAEAGAPLLREAHTRLFPYLTTPGGVRIVDLAAHLGVSKQAIQPLIAELERQRVVFVRPDPDDARAKRVHLSQQGAAAFAHGTGILVSLEATVSPTLGRRRLERLRRDLGQLLSVLVRSVDGDGRQTAALGSGHTPVPQKGTRRAAPRDGAGRAGNRPDRALTLRAGPVAPET